MFCSPEGTTIYIIIIYCNTQNITNYQRFTKLSKKIEQDKTKKNKRYSYRNSYRRKIYCIFAHVLKFMRMASIKFYLTRPQAKEETSIYFLFSYGIFQVLPNGKKKYLPLKYYTNLSILPDNWDAKTGRPLTPTAKNKRVNAIAYKELNAALNNIEVTVKDILRRIENDGIKPTNELLTAELDSIYKAYKNVTPIATDNLLSFIENYISICDRKPLTIKGYKQTQRELKDYSLARNKALSFSEIDLDFYFDFIEHLTAKGYSPNTIGTRIKDLKMFMNEAYDRGLHTNLDFKKKRFKKPSEETFSVYLSSEELTKIYNLNLTSSKRLDKVRDLFIIGCFTGLRFSDLSQLTANNVSIDGTITIKTIKTEHTVVIPLHAIVKQILEKYEYNLPKVPSNQKFNDYIKDIAKLADITETIYIDKKKGDLSYKQTIPKWQLVTSHTARRSFATNAFIAGVPTISIMKITGHKTESSFMKYIKISEKENALQLRTHSFFNQMVVNK